MKINIRYEISIQQTGAVGRGEYHRRGRLLGGGLPESSFFLKKKEGFSICIIIYFGFYGL